MCESIESFKNLLNVNSKINVTNRKIIYEDSVYNFTLDLVEYPKRYQNIFTLEICIDPTHNSDKFQRLLKIIRELLHKTSISVNILWDDLSAKYCKKAYPEINNIGKPSEKVDNKIYSQHYWNWMDRKQFTKRFEESYKKENRESYSNILH